MTNEEASRILHCPSAYLTDEDSEFAHVIPLLSKAYGQAMTVAFEALKRADVLDKIRAEIEALPKTYPFMNHFDTYVKEDDVKKIIDKYNAESEEP